MNLILGGNVMSKTTHPKGPYRYEVTFKISHLLSDSSINSICINWENPIMNFGETKEMEKYLKKLFGNCFSKCTITKIRQVVA